VGKTIVLLFDGTWNDSEFSQSDTNIVRLREVIAHSCHGSVSNPPLVMYERGLGTGPLDSFRGGALGMGLSREVRSGYRFLSGNFEVGDQVFIFGFSRGAFTARSLVGYIQAAGLLKRDACTTANESRAWYYYRTRPIDRMAGTSAELRNCTHAPEDVVIECLGVFDTVGSLGVPFRWFSRANRALFEFHDVYLAPIVKHHLHALAIDEHRWPFKATLWRRPKFSTTKSTVEQVWFPGAHADIGGGNIERDRFSSPAGIDDAPLDWMIKRVRPLLAERDFLSGWSDLGTHVACERTEKVTKAPIHEARKHAYRLFPFSYRSIGNLRFQPSGSWRALVGWDRHDVPIHERLHISALERLGTRARNGSFSSVYAPPNLSCALAPLATTYEHPDTRGLGGEQDLSYRIPELLTLVDWCGDTLCPSNSNDCERALAVIHAAKRRLRAAKIVVPSASNGDMR
jgi:hypothetical protein